MTTTNWDIWRTIASSLKQTLFIAILFSGTDSRELWIMGLFQIAWSGLTWRITSIDCMDWRQQQWHCCWWAAVVRIKNMQSMLSINNLRDQYISLDSFWRTLKKKDIFFVFKILVHLVHSRCNDYNALYKVTTYWLTETIAHGDVLTYIV